MMRKVLLGDVIKINPTTKVTKNQIVKFVSMDKLDPFTRVPNGYEKRKFSSGAKFTNGDTLLARITPCLENGKTAFVDFLDDLEVAAGSTEFVILRNIEGLTDPAYIYYLSISPAFRDYAIKSMVGTSGRQRVQNDVLAKMELSLPPLDQQKKIANILSSLDEKIELNRHMNETLEQLGQALFRHYFIDNPDANSWKNIHLGDIVAITTGKGSTKANLSEYGKYPLYGANGIMGRSQSYLLNEKVIVTGRVGTLGVVRAVVDKAWFSDNVIIMKPDPSIFGYVFYVVCGIDYVSLNRGSTQPLITQTDLKNQRVKLPPLSTLQRFENSYAVIFNQIQANKRQMSMLVAIRDSLLPKLISGEIEV